MKKSFVKIIVLVLVILIIMIGIAYLVDRNRMKNNQSVIFSTWGYLYSPSIDISTIQNRIVNNETLKEEEKRYFFAKVISISENSIIVEPNEGERERNSSDKISIGLDKENNKIYTVGDIVRIKYNGTIMETYPAQIITNEIKVLNKVELMYETMIDNIMQEDEALNSDMQYISLDIDSFCAPQERVENNVQSKYLDLKDSEKQTILDYCTKYNKEVKSLSMEKLKQEGLFNEESMSLDGILIYISEVEKIQENTAVITMAKYRSGLGAIFPKYELKYEDGKWNIKVIEMAIS